MTTDYGQTWTPIAGNLPAQAAYVHVVREDPKRNRSLLYIGTEMGIWASLGSTARTGSIAARRLPAAPVRDSTSIRATTT